MFSRFAVLFMLTMSIILLSGCSGNDPVTPVDNSVSPDPTPVFELSDFNGTFEGIGLMGAYELTIDPDELKADFSTKRYGAIGEDYLVSGLGFFTNVPCADCLDMKSITLTPDGNITLTFSIRHPFQPGTTSLPPSASNRLDLDIFDLGMVIHPLETTGANYPLTGDAIYDQICVNPPFYTTELADLTGDDTALPCFLVVDDNAAATSTYNKFEMGGSAEFDVTFFVTTSLRFDMYLTMGYGFSAKKLQRLNPKYYNPEFNRKPPWKIKITPPNGEDPPAADNTWLDNDGVTTHDVTVEIYDWQIGATVYTGTDFGDAPADNIFAPSGVAMVSVEIPGMTNTLPSATTPDSGNGAPNDPLVFTVPVANQNLLPVGEYTGLVKVTDERIPLSDTLGRDYLIDSPDGIALNNYTIPEYAAYQVFTATVVFGNLEPNCAFDLADTSVNIGDTTICTPGAMSDPDGTIVSYEWDLDYDGAVFDADITQLSTDPGFGDPFILGPFCNETYVDTTHTVALRVTDDGSPPSEVICTNDIDVLANWLHNPGDLVADTVNRGEGSADAELITSVTLTWENVPCAFEYVIEKANSTLNPTIWTEVATCTEATYDYPVGTSEMETTHRVRVYARMFDDDDTVVTDYSEHVAMVFASAFRPPGDPRMLERTREYVGAAGNPSLASGGFYDVSGDYNVDAWPSDHLYTYACFTNPSGYWDFTNRWAIHYREFPDLVGQTTAYVDAYVQTRSDRAFCPGSGWCFGTLGTTVPELDTWIPNVYDFLPANSPRGSLYEYETSNIEGFLTEFGDGSQAGFQSVSGDDTWEHTSYYLNDLLNADRDFFAIGYAVGSTSPSTIPHTDYLCLGLTDAIAVIVY